MSDSHDDTFEKLVRRVAKTPEVAAIPRSIVPGTLMAGRFEVETRLGAGGMGQVFAAFDRVGATRVALKILGKMALGSTLRLKREFRAASELAHPNLVRLHELFLEGSEYFFTMDLIHGLSMEEYLRGSPQGSEERLRHVFRQLALGISALHEAGTLHGDLKPPNFLIARPEDRVVLLDFGLARPLGANEQQEVGGTPAYMAPEYALGADITESADWYALGVILYEALTGGPPFGRPSAGRLRDAPHDLRTLCLDLLELRPEDRPVGADVLRRLGGSRPSGRPSRFVCARPSVVGRVDELSRLREALAASASGQPMMALVHGASGIGKTALIEQFLASLTGTGTLVLKGRCRERESMAYKAVDSIIDDLAEILGSPGAMDVQPFLQKDVADLTVLFPALCCVPHLARGARRVKSILELGLVRLRAIAAFRALLAGLRAHAPLVVWIDDLQWSDAESALLLAPVLGGSEPVPIFFIGSFRDASEKGGPMLTALLSDASATYPEPVDIPLDTLSDEAATRLVLELLHGDRVDAGRAARDVVRESGGHPLFIIELAHAIANRDSAEDRARSTLFELVGDRVRGLPPRAREVLEVVAVAGTPVSRTFLRKIPSLEPTPVDFAIDVLRAHRLARTYGLRDDDPVDLHHDRIREIVLQTISDDDRKGLHRIVAIAMEDLPVAKPDLLAVHYQAAGDFERAGRNWIAAAKQAGRALAFSHAADLYEKGLGLATFDVTERREIRIERARMLASAGKGRAAAQAYEEAASDEDHDSALEYRRLAAEQLLLSGHVEQGLTVIEGVLAKVGMRKPMKAHGVLFSIAVGRLFVRARGLRHAVRPQSQLTRIEVERLDAAWTLACSLSLIDPIRGVDFQNRHLLLALRCGEPRRLLRALTLEASYAAIPGVGSEHRTTNVLALADALARESDDPAAMGLLFLARGIAAYLQGRNELALAECEEALSLLTHRCVGAVWERMSAQRFVIASLFFLGKFRRLAAFVPPLLADAEGTGNLYATTCFRSAYGSVAWLTTDTVHEARRQLNRARQEWAGAGFHLAHYNLLIGDCHVDLYTGDAERTRARLLEHWTELKHARLLRIGVLRVQLWHLLAASSVVVARFRLQRGQRSEAGALLREARGTIRKLRRAPTRRAPGIAALTEAAIDFSEGDVASSRVHLTASINAFEEQGMRLFSAAARVRLGALTSGGIGASLVDTGFAAFRDEGVASPERMLDMLAPGFGEHAT
jgi:eukaryotic-like serine/threonine-protein kinase